MNKKFKLKGTVLDIFKQYDNKYNLTSQEFKIILSTFNFLMISDMIKTGTAYNLPHSNGTLVLGRVKNYRKFYPDFKLMREQKIAVPIRNTHSGGEYALFKWYPAGNKGYSEIKTLWKFRAYRPNKKLLSESIIKDNSILNYPHV